MAVFNGFCVYSQAGKALSGGTAGYRDKLM